MRMFLVLSLLVFWSAFGATPSSSVDSAAKKAPPVVSSTVLISVPCPDTAISDDRYYWHSGACHAMEKNIAWPLPETMSEADLVNGYSNPPTTTIEACNRTRQRILDATAKLDAKRQEPQQIKAGSPRPLSPPPPSSACVMCRNAWDNQCKHGGYDGTDFCAELIKSNCAQDCRTF